MNITQKIIEKGHPNRLGWPIEAPVLAIVVHGTANANPGTGALWHANFFGRKYELGSWLDSTKKTVMNGYIEFGSKGFDPANPNLGRQFRVASTHAAVDSKSVVQILPLNEFAAGSGDRPLPYEPFYKGQKPQAKWIFDNRQNYRTLQIEICENSDGDWGKACENARGWIADTCHCLGLTIDLGASLAPERLSAPPASGKIYLMEHFDITGKLCPRLFMNDRSKWLDFVGECAKTVNG